MEYSCALRAGILALAAVACFGRISDPQLIAAVKKGDAGAVRAVLARNPDINQAAVDGSTALYWAAWNDNVAMADMLIAAGASANTPTRYKVTPLSVACTNGNAVLIEHLLKAGADANGMTEDGQTPLMTCSLTGKTDAMKALLAHGAKVNIKEPYKGQTALMWAASEGNAAAAALLVEFGEDVKARSKGGSTPLLFAVRNGHIDAAKILLEHGANVNDIAPDGTSALNMAVVNAYFELGSVLLDHGANPNLSDPRGSALHTLAWLRKPGSDGAAGVGATAKAPPIPKGNMTSLELAKALLQHGANPNVRIDWKEKKFEQEGGTVKNPPNIDLGRHYLSYVGATPFYVAAQNGDVAYMRFLVENGADPKMGTVQGITPLMAASGLGTWEGETPGPYTGCTEAERLEAVKLALELGNDINAHANFGDYKIEGTPEYTLLYYPLNMDQLVDKVLGDPRWNGSTALHGAVTSGQPSIVQFLLAHGALPDAKNKLGWTPIMLAEGAFYANAKKEFPGEADILRKALTAKQTK
jgi:uncharacterized protein